MSHCVSYGVGGNPEAILSTDTAAVWWSWFFPDPMRAAWLAYYAGYWR